MQIVTKDKIRNIAIIAHVDHGKTTLVDAFIRQSHTFRDNAEEMAQDRILDSNDLERERGITISAKNISLPYKEHKINIIDTPGHADFGGEVERTLNMADGCILVVDAQEGVMPQTKFVLKKAFELGLKPIVVINKVDKKLADVKRTYNKIQDLFLNLATEDNQLEFKTFYAVARDGKVWAENQGIEPEEYVNVEGTVEPLLDAVLELVPAPEGDIDAPFVMQVSSLEFDPHYGRSAVGRIHSGTIKKTSSIIALNDGDADYKVNAKIKGLFLKDGLVNATVDEAGVGEIVAIAGLDGVAIGDTICDANYDKGNPTTLPVLEISPPSLKIKFEANTSPFLGKESKYPNLKQLQARLDKEAEANVSLKIEHNGDGSYYVSGRGELHLGILIETMRREGYEFQLSKPEVIYKKIDGKKNEPMEEVYIEVPEEYYSTVLQELNTRGADLEDIQNENGVSRMTYFVRTKSLLGLRRVLLTSTKGNLVMNTTFAKYVPFVEDTREERHGRLISNATGKALAYALNNIQERGELLIGPSVEVYEGMVIGLNKYDSDILVNPLKAREKSNVRMSRAEITLVSLKTPLQMTLEYAIGMVTDDEILEITPLNIRLRKRFLNKQDEYNAKKRKSKK